ncbi:hypothetical protein CQ056_00555 [Peribacillus simplex]|nr:hypothetical protein CQ056_00555 [Peribacillus simplex]
MADIFHAANVSEGLRGNSIVRIIPLYMSVQSLFHHALTFEKKKFIFYYIRNELPLFSNLQEEAEFC